MTSSPIPLQRLRRAAARAAFRLRLRDLVQRGIGWLPLPLVYGIVALAYVKLAHPGPALIAHLITGLAGLVLLLVVLAAHAWLRPRHPLAGAIAIDRHQGLDGRVGNALAFAELPSEARTPLMKAAIEDALTSTPRLSPAEAVPLPWPRELPLVAVLFGGLVFLALLEVRTARLLPPPPVAPSPVLSADDLELYRDLAKELETRTRDAESLVAVRRFNQLLKDLEERRLDRREAFQRLEELERALLDGAEAEQQALEDGLSAVAKELEASELSRPIARAFEEKRLADAEQALRALADRLRDRGQPPTRADLERLREALRRASLASEAREERLAEERQRVEQERKRLLEKQADGAMTPRDQGELAQRERQLERLDRERRSAQGVRRQLSELDRQLAEAARELMEAAGRSAESLDAAAEDVNRMAREELSRQEKEELLRQLREMRELMRQQGKGGEDREERMRRFAERARGQAGDDPRGSGRGGEQEGTGSPRRIALRPGSGSGTQPGDAAGRGQGAGQSSGLRGKEGAGNQPGGEPGGAKGGHEAGRGHDPNLAGDATELDGELQDVTAVAADTGQGSASSQVIMGASERGFVGRGYRDVYVDYRTVAEAEMRADEIPPGYRFYVQRYFQLIRPRD